MLEEAIDPRCRRELDIATNGTRSIESLLLSLLLQLLRMMEELLKGLLQRQWQLLALLIDREILVYLLQ